jgi:hypothetical protein
MEAVQGISPYSYPYLNQQNCFVLLIIVYTLSSTKLEIRAKQFLPGNEGVGGEGESERGGGWGEGGEMTQTLYAHTNKQKK